MWQVVEVVFLSKVTGIYQSIIYTTCIDLLVFLRNFFFGSSVYDVNFRRISSQLTSAG